MISPQISQDGGSTFQIGSVSKGLWSNRSTLSMPEAFCPTITNFDLDGGIPTSMKGDADFIATAWPNDGGVINLLTYHRSAAGVTTYILGTTAGIIYKWSGAAWVTLRVGLSTTATLWWASQRYGTDVYISNPTDGIYKYDGDTLVPVGAKPIMQMENDEAGDWTNETADTDVADLKEGLQSFKIDSPNPGTATLTYNPAAAINAQAGRGSARPYLLAKATGTDFFHFWVKFEGAGTLDTTNTKVVITDTGAKTLTWPMTQWRTARSATAAVASAASTAWQEIYLLPTQATEVATFDPTIIDSIAFVVVTSAGVRTMFVDDFYAIYATTMSAVNFLAEWRNMLWGATPQALFFSPENAPDEFNILATLAVKSNGDLITGLKNFYNQLTITTETQTHTISGTVGTFAYPAYLFDLNMVTDELGCSSHRTMVKAGEKLYWWFNTQIVEYDGTNVRKVSFPLDVFLTDSEPTTKPFFVGAPFRKKNQVWWTYRRANEATNDRVLRFDYVMQAFLPCVGLTTPLLTQVYDGSEEYLLSVNTTTRLVKKQGQASVFTFSGTDIAYVLEFQPLLVTGLASEWATAELFYLTNTGNLTVAFRIADHLRGLAAAAYNTAETVNMAADGEYGKIRFGDRARLFQLKLTATAALVEIEFPLTVKAVPIGAHHDRVTP